MTKITLVVRVAVLRDGTIQVWDKSNGVELAILDYRKGLPLPEIQQYDEKEIGFTGDY